MRKWIILGIPALSALVLLCGRTWADDPMLLPPGFKEGRWVGPSYYKGTGRSAFTALKVGQSARASGMGDAFTAVSDDINAIYWNVAGLTRVKRFAYALGYTRWFVDSKFFTGALARRVGAGTVGVSFIQFQGPTSLETTPLDPQGKSGREISGGNVFVKAAYARQIFDRLSIGLSAKWLQERLDDVRANSINFDFSSLYYTGIGSSRLAMSFNNVGPNRGLIRPGSTDVGTAFAQPFVYTVAAAMEVIGRKDGPYRLTGAVELAHHLDDRERMHFGGELWLANTLALRAGYRWRYDTGRWTLGAGVKRDFDAGHGIGVDVSYVDRELFNTAPVRVSLTGTF